MLPLALPKVPTQLAPSAKLFIVVLRNQMQPCNRQSMQGVASIGLNFR